MGAKFDMRDTFLLDAAEPGPIEIDNERFGKRHVRDVYDDHGVTETRWDAAGQATTTKKPLAHPVWEGNLFGVMFAALPLEQGASYAVRFHQYDKGEGTFAIDVTGQAHDRHAGRQARGDRAAGRPVEGRADRIPSSAHRRAWSWATTARRASASRLRRTARDSKAAHAQGAGEPRMGRLPDQAAAMPNVPACPQCTLENTYADGDRFVCADCGHEWTPDAGDGHGRSAVVVRDSNGKRAGGRRHGRGDQGPQVKGSSIPLKQGTVIRQDPPGGGRPRAHRRPLGEDQGPGAQDDVPAQRPERKNSFALNTRIARRA
jgi:protein PhnA